MVMLVDSRVLLHFQDRAPKGLEDEEERKDCSLERYVFQGLTCKSLGAGEGKNEAVVVLILQDRLGVHVNYVPQGN